MCRVWLHSFIPQTFTEHPLYIPRHVVGNEETEKYPFLVLMGRHPSTWRTNG